MTNAALDLREMVVFLAATGVVLPFMHRLRISPIIGFVGIGLLLGVVGGVALALNIDVVVPAIERLLGIQFLSKEVYYISDLPSELQWKDVWMVTGISFVLALLATLYPSWRAARVNPAEALRYE